MNRIGLITMNGSGTSIHTNATGGYSNKYGLNTYSTTNYGLYSYSSSSIHLVSPLTKQSISINNGGGDIFSNGGKVWSGGDEVVSINNGGGGNYGGSGTIKTIEMKNEDSNQTKTDTVSVY